MAVEMKPSVAVGRRELVSVCLVIAFVASVIYDTRLIVPLEGLRALVAAGVVACFGAVMVLSKYPKSVIQPALLAAWPLHLNTIFFVGVVWCFHGGEQKSAIVAYTIVAYATWLMVPFCLLSDRCIFDRFAKLVAIGSAFLAIPSFVGALGIDSFLGFPLSNKYGYSELSGIIASGGIFEHAEGQALQMAIGLLCAFYAFRRSGSYLYAGCLALTMAGLVISQGRGAIFGVLIAAAFCLLPEVFRRSRWLFVGTLVVCLIFPFLIWPQLSKIPGFAGYLRMERGLSGRDVAWQYAISLIEEEPWVGHGFGSSAELSEEGRVLLRKSGYSGIGTTFHNTFITRAAEMGIVAASVYALLYIVPLLRVCRRADDELQQQLIRNIAVLALTAAIFRDYNIGGVRSTSMLVAIYFGLANLLPLSNRIIQASSQAVDRRAHVEESPRDATGGLLRVPGQSLR